MRSMRERNGIGRLALFEQQTTATVLYQSTIANWHYLSSFHQSVIHVDEEVSTSTVCWTMLLLLMMMI